METVDLFCGCGGSSCGLMQSGFDVKLGVDWDQTALQTYQSNFRHACLQHDLANWLEAVEHIKKLVPKCRVISGSPPCTDFSRAGRQQEGSRADLTMSFAKIVEHILPDIFVMENVPDVEQSFALRDAIALLRSIGYSMVKFVKDARYCNVPQNRRRFFLIGCAATEFNESQLNALLNDSVEREKIVSVKEYCEKEYKVSCPDYLYFFPRNQFQAQVVSSKLPYPTLRSTNGVCMNRKPSLQSSVQRPNDAASMEEAVELSVQLASAISTFPPDFIWPSSRKAVGMQLGNCVPPNLAKTVGLLVRKHLSAVESLPEQQGNVFENGKKQIPKKVSHANIFFDAFSNELLSTHVSVNDIKCGEELQSEAAYKSSDVCDSPKEYRYKMGTDKTVDLAANKTIGFDLKDDWIFVIKERRCQKSRIDDMFVYVPNEPIPYRGKSLLIKNNHL